MKIAVSCQGPRPTDRFDERFGRAAYLLIYDTTSDSWAAFDNSQNREAQSGAGIGAASKVAETGAQVVITGHVGPKAAQALQAAGIQVVLSTASTPTEAVAEFLANKKMQLT